MGATRTKVKYNLRLDNLEDIRPETLSDRNGILQSDHNRLNDIARNKLKVVEKTVRNNQAKLSEIEKLTIKQQTEIDFIKRTPTNFDLARVELFQNRFGTRKELVTDGIPDAEIITELFEPREDGNFEFGVLKNPRSKYLGAVEKAVNLSSLFGSSRKDIAYGETTRSIWIVTSDGPGERAYLFRCGLEFIDGQLNILSYWQLDAAGGSREHTGVCESTFNGVTTIMVGVSDESGFGAHFINRYRIRYNEKENLVTIADGQESSPLVPIFKGNGEILDGEVSTTIADLSVERVDISDPGKLRGLETVNEYLYIAIQNDSTSSEEEIDSFGYSFIRRVTITDIGVLTGGVNTYKYKLDDILEDGLNQNTGSNKWDLYGISAYRITNTLQQYSNVDQADIDDSFENSEDRNLFYIGVQNSSGLKRIALLDLNFADLPTNNPNFNKGFQNINTLSSDISGYTNQTSAPFITTLLDRTLLEVHQSNTSDIIAIHDLSGYDLFQGMVDYSAKVKRYFNTENFHAQLGVVVNAVAANQTQAITAGPDNDFSFTTAGGTRNRNLGTSPARFSEGNIFNFHNYLSGQPFWAKPQYTFAVTDGVDNPVSGVAALTWEGDVNSGTALYVSYLNNYEQPSLIKVDSNDINSVNPQIGADNFSQYEILTGTDSTPVSGSIGAFAGPVAYDPVNNKLWVATTNGFIHNITDGGNTLDFNIGNSFKVLKTYPQSVSNFGEITDGSLITALSIFDNQAYVGMNVPDNFGNAPDNTIVRVFDIDRSTSTQPISTSLFAVKGSVKDFNITDNGFYITRGESNIDKVYESQFGNNVFESTEVFDEFNFFANPVASASNGNQFGNSIKSTTFMTKQKSTEAFQKREWVLPRRAVAFGIKSTSDNTINPGKLKILDYSDVNNPLDWATFDISFSSVSNPTNFGVSGALLSGSGEIDSLTFIDDKLFVGRRDYGIGTVVNVIDFANDSATILVDTIAGLGSTFSGLRFGFKEIEEVKTGGLNEANNPDYHYSGIANPNIKLGTGRILDMDSALLSNNTNSSITTPYVIIGHEDTGIGSGSVSVINANTLESVVGIGPGTGSAKKVVINPDGSAFAATQSGVIYKIDDVRLIGKDNAQYTADFSAQSITPFYPTDTGSTSTVNNLTDFKVKNYINTLGNSRNIIYATFAEGSGSASMAVKFEYETVAEAGGSTASEFLNNAEIIYFDPSADRNVNSIDFLDNRIFLAFEDPRNDFRMSVLKKFDIVADEESPYSNNWTPILGSNGAVPNFVDYIDLYYNGIKSQITNLTSIPRMSLLFADTEAGSIVFKFPFVEKSKWFSTTQTIRADVNAVALARDAFVEDGFVTEFIDRNDSRIEFTGNWSDEVSPVTLPYTAPLYNLPEGRKKMRGKIVDNLGQVFNPSTFNIYDPFSVALDNGISFAWDGIDITNYNLQDGGNYDYNDNILMIKNENGVQVFDFVSITPGNVDFLPLFEKGKPLATVSLNDFNSSIKFFDTISTYKASNTTNAFFEETVNFDISQNPVIVIKTLDGTPLSTFQEATATGEADGNESAELVTDNLATTQKLITDPLGNPVNTIVLTGRSAKSQNKFTKKVKVSTFNFSIRERL